MDKSTQKFLPFIMVMSLLGSTVYGQDNIQLAEALPLSPAVVPHDPGPTLRHHKAAKSTQANSKKQKAQPDQAPVAQIISVKKKVDVQPSGKEWQPATNRSVVKGDDKIRTGSRSVARVKMQDGSTVLLLQNSEAEMENLSSVKKTIKLLRGKVRAVVKRLQGPGSFQVKTPIGVASVRGTEFEVEYQEESKNMAVDVLQGEVGVSKLGDLANEVVVSPGEKVQFGAEGEIGSPSRSGAVPMEAQDVQVELYNDQVKQSVISMAAEEERNADYQTGKSLIDVDGKRVRVEEYIMRPAANQFKLVALNERSDHFDYFTYKGTFNTTLPDDLSIALKQVGGQLGSTAPDYHLTDYEMLMSNTKDNITESATGGHIVKIDFDGTNYTLSDPNDITNTRTISASEQQSDGSYKIYDPIHDSFSLVAASELTDATKIAVLDPDTNAYRDLTSGDTYWKTRYDSSSFFINTTAKTGYAKKSLVNHTLAIDLDADFTNAPITTISEYPSGTSTLHNRLSLYYQDGSKTVFDNYIIDDQGVTADASVFSGLPTSESYKNELVKWNYQQKVKSTEMSDEINLVIDPRIGTMSGLIQ